MFDGKSWREGTDICQKIDFRKWQATFTATLDTATVPFKS